MSNSNENTVSKSIDKNKTSFNKIRHLQNVIRDQEIMINKTNESLRVTEIQKAFTESEYSKLYKLYHQQINYIEKKEEYYENRIKGLIEQLDLLDDLEIKYDDLLKKFNLFKETKD